MTRDYENCVARATKALEIIQHTLLQPHDETQFLDSYSSRRIRSIPLPHLTAASEAGNGAIDVFNRALAFDCGYSRDKHHDVVLAGVLLYNAGLCHHVQAIEHAGSRCLLRRAMRMYSMASALLTTSGVLESDGSGQTDDVVLLVLALMNNMAHIHTCFVDLERAWDCLDTIREECDCLGDNILTQEEFCFFGMSSTFIPPRDSFKASPAA